jgi:antitoxin component of MazEF toxin-antitoxin module
MVELKVRKFGNSLGVLLPKGVIDRLQAKAGESLFLTEAAAGSYLLTPHDIVSEKTDDILERYPKTLRVLRE